MTYATVLTLGREAIFVAMATCAPALVLGMLTGLLISVFQAVTQIQEPTLAFIPKILVVGLAIMLFGPYMLAMMTDFLSRVFLNLPQMLQ